MKMYKKSKLQYKNGFIVKDDKIVNVDNEIVDLFNKIEEDVQRWQHEKLHPIKPVEPAVPFARKTERGNVIAHVEAKTPELDSLAEKAMTIMDEIDSVGDAEKCNEYFESIRPVIQFTDDEFVVDCEQATQHRFDLPTLGNPLEITKESLCTVIVNMFM